MDSSRKRRHPPTTPSSDARSVKKIKLLNTSHVSDNDKTPQKVGLRLITQLHNAADKTGRPIIGAFKTLPRPDELPDYYEQTKLPLALDIIESKLHRDVYPTVSSVESDFKRMIQNAKDYNMPKSDVYEDAERIRKLVYNFMKTNNPAYQLDPSYSAIPTPIPADNAASSIEGVRKVDSTPSARAADEDRTNGQAKSQSRRASIKIKRPAATDSEDTPRTKATATPPPSAQEHGKDATNLSIDFDGRSFQDAQQMIVAKLIEYTDADGLEIFTPFINLPSRALEDYYRLIRHPVSLKGVQKRTKGQHGRNPPTNITDFKTWDAFEEEASFIWRNAREYNEDGSEMYELAGELRDRFTELVNDARAKIDEPAGTRLKLGASKSKSGFTLNLTQHRNSPTPGASVDNEALVRPRQAVQTVAASQPTQPRQLSASDTARSTPQVLPAEAARPPSSTNDNTPPITAAVKSEKVTATSVVSGTSHPTQSGTKPTTLGSTSAAGITSTHTTPLPNGVPPAHPLLNSSSAPYIAPSLLPPTSLRAYPASLVMLTSVNISSTAGLKLKQPYSLTVYPHEVLSQRSVTVTLPSAYYVLQIAPTISRELSMGRPYKMFVAVNGTRISQRDTHFHADTGRRTHVYEGHLALGVNRLEIEIAAVKMVDKSEGKGLDVEKVTAFVNLTR